MPFEGEKQQIYHDIFPPYTCIEVCYQFPCIPLPHLAQKLFVVADIVVVVVAALAAVVSG